MLKSFIKRFTNSGNLHSLLGNITFAVFSLITFLILVRLLDKTLFGQWVLFVTIASLLDMLRLGLTGTAAIRLLSRSTKDDSQEIAGSSYTLGIKATIIIAILFLSAYFFIMEVFPTDSYYLQVLLYYPALALANLPFNQANVLAQGKINFKRILVLKTINGASILLFLSLYILFFEVTFDKIIIAYIAANFLSSCITLLAGWDEISYIRKATQKTSKRILQFGKYSTASSVGSSLLRSSDTIILSMAPFLGAEAIAIYAIPLKFVEAVEIPLRSFTATAFPRFSKALITSKDHFKTMLLSYTAWSTIILLPVIFILLLFPAFFLQLIGGFEYYDFLQVQKDILLVICIYIFLLPLDRYSGVALFALNKPRLNFQKILIMLVANIIFDVLAIFVFHSLIYVALATLLFTFLGILTGWYMVLRETQTALKSFSDYIIGGAYSYITNMKSWFYLEK